MQVAAAIEVSAPELVVDAASNEAVISGAIDLGEYQAVVWILGEESTADKTFDTVEQSLVSQYLAAGGKLFVSGSEIGFDLDGQNNGRDFYNNQLRANYVADDAGTYGVSGTPGSIFDGLSFTFDNGSQFYNVDFPDVIAPAGGSTAALTYSTGNTAGVLYDGGPGGGQVVMFAFPFETITDATLRNQVLGRVLEFFDFDLTYTDIDAILDNDDGLSVYTETGTWSSSPSPGFDGGTFRFTPTGSPATASWNFYTPFAGQGEVFVQYRSGVNRASSAVYHIDTGHGIESVVIDQKTNDLTWVPLGTFDFTAGGHTITLDAAASSGGSVVIADVARIVLPVPGTAPSADFNGDGSVDGRDFLAWQRGFGGSNANPSEGDANNDRHVDGADLAIWQAQYGTTSPAAQIVTHAAADTILNGESVSSFVVSLLRTREPIALESSTSLLAPEQIDSVAHENDEITSLRDWLVRISGGRSPEAPLRALPSQDAEDFRAEFDEVFAELANDEV